jgi:hypothetical protein
MKAAHVQYVEHASKAYREPDAEREETDDVEKGSQCPASGFPALEHDTRYRFVHYLGQGWLT